MTTKPDNSDVMVSWIEPIATDANGVVPLVFKTHSPGSVFDVGTTTVRYTFGRDPVDTASCIFTVTVAEGIVIILLRFHFHDLLGDSCCCYLFV